jgi:hypothetical protein
VKHVSGKYLKEESKMAKAGKNEKKSQSSDTSLVRKAALNIGLFVLAIVMIGMGIYLFSGPSWVQRGDIKLYNQAVSTSAMAKELLPATDDRPAEFPLVRAAAYYQEVIDESTDDGLRAVTLYNLGTLMGDDAASIIRNTTPSFGIAEAYARLIEAVRLDPTNEDAKYNLELCEKIQAIITPTRAVIIVQPTHGTLGGSSGFSSGLAHKGY